MDQIAAAMPGGWELGGKEHKLFAAGRTNEPRGALTKLDPKAADVFNLAIDDPAKSLLVQLYALAADIHNADPGFLKVFPWVTITANDSIISHIPPYLESPAALSPDAAVITAPGVGASWRVKLIGDA